MTFAHLARLGVQCRARVCCLLQRLVCECAMWSAKCCNGICELRGYSKEGFTVFHLGLARAKNGRKGIV